MELVPSKGLEPWVYWLASAFRAKRPIRDEGNLLRQALFRLVLKLMRVCGLRAKG